MSGSVRVSSGHVSAQANCSYEMTEALHWLSIRFLAQNEPDGQLYT